MLSSFFVVVTVFDIVTNITVVVFAVIDHQFTIIFNQMPLLLLLLLLLCLFVVLVIIIIFVLQYI